MTIISTMLVTTTEMKVLCQRAWRQISSRFWRQTLAIWMASLCMFFSVYVRCYLLQLGDHSFEVHKTAMFDRPCDLQLGRECGWMGNASCGTSRNSRVSDSRVGVEVQVTSTNIRSFKLDGVDTCT